MSGEILEVRVSRKLLLILALVGLLFLVAGIDIGFTNKLIGPEIGQDKPTLKWIFIGFATALGGLISVNCFIYLLSPPVMLRVTRDKISFGTGFRYNLFDLPADKLEKVETFMQESAVEVNGKKAIVEGGTAMYFKNSDDIPAQKTTSAGIQYHGHRLIISSTYSDTGSKEIVERAKAILGLR